MIRRTRRKMSKVLTRVLSLVLCVALLGTTYAGFFGGLKAGASSINTFELGPGEVGLDKTVTQWLGDNDELGRGADITVRAAAMPVEITTSTTTSTDQVVDVVLVIDTSSSMTGDPFSAVKQAAKNFAAKLFDMNPSNRIALCSFDKEARAFKTTTTGGVELRQIDTSASFEEYFFAGSKASALENRINNLSVTSGTNSEGGLLVAEKLLEISDPDRQKLVIFMTDGLPHERYKDTYETVTTTTGFGFNKKTTVTATDKILSYNTIVTNDGFTGALPSYQELSELLSSAERISNSENVQMATVFYANDLSTTMTYTEYYNGCNLPDCGCNTGKKKHDEVAIVDPEEAKTEEQILMSGFYKKSALECAEYIVYDKLKPLCKAGVHMTDDVDAMVEAFDTVLTTYVTSNMYQAADNAYYKDIVPDYAEVVDGSVNVSVGTAEVRSENVTIDGKVCERDVVYWDFEGAIPEEIQTLNYSIKVKDEKTYGIMDASVQGILTYTESDYTKTKSPLIVQLDEIILPPKGVDDYYVVPQGEILEDEVKTNDDPKNALLDYTGDVSDSVSIVNGYPAGLKGSQQKADMPDYAIEVREQPKWGTVVANVDGTFSYVQKPELYATDVRTLNDDDNGTTAYNNVDMGWEDTFTYVLTTANLTGYDVSGIPDRIKADEAIVSEPITVHIRIEPNTESLTAVKTSDPLPGTLVKSGDTIEYSISVTNPRSVEVSGVEITDTIPLGVTLTQDSISDSGEYADGKVTWNVDIPAKQTKTVSFKVTVDENITATGCLSNVALAEFTTPGSEEPTRITTDPVNHAYIHAVKSSNVEADTVLNQGDQIEYTISVKNCGSAPAANVAVSDTLPAGLTYVSGDGSFANGVFTAAIDSLDPGAGKDIKVTVSVNNFESGSVIFKNQAVVNDVPTNEVENVAKRGKVTVYFKEMGSNTDLLDPTGGTGKYGDSYGFSHDDIINKDEYSYRYHHVDGSPSGSYNDGEQVVTFYYEKIPGYATVRYVDTEGTEIKTSDSVSGNQGDTLENLYGKLDTIDPHYEYVRTDDSQGYTLTESGITITHIYKVTVDTTLPTVSKTADPADGSVVTVGSEINYTIAVTNNKYEAMTNVTVTDSAPKGTTLLSADGAAVSGSTATWTFSSIAPGKTEYVVMKVRVDSAFTGFENISNIASVTYTDRESTTPTTVNSNVTEHAVLISEKSISDNDRGGFYGVGDTFTYSIKVTNYGTADAKGVVISDVLPEGVTLVNGETSAAVDINAGASYTLRFEVKANDISTYEAPVVNTATVNGVPTNEVVTSVKKGVLVVKYQDTEGKTLENDDISYGTPGDSYVTAAKAIPAYTYKEIKEGNPEGQYIAGETVVVYVYERTPANAVIMYKDIDSEEEIDTRVPLTGFVGDQITDKHWHEITNYEYIKTVPDTDCVMTDDDITIIHYYRFIRPDDTAPEFVKSSDPVSGTILHEGESVTYTLAFRNTRIDPIKNLTITDYIPQGSTLEAADVVPDENGKLTWTVEELAPNEEVKFQFTVRVNSGLTGKDNMSNVARASFQNRDGEPEDPVDSNTVKHPVIEGVLDHFNNQPDAILTEGDEITYVITVTNTGAATAYDVPVTSSIPEGTTFKFTEDGEVNGDEFTATIPKLAPGESVELKFTVTIDEFPNGVYKEDIPNIATVDGVETNDVHDYPEVGDVVVTHYDYDGVIKQESATGRVGTDYGPYADLVSENKLPNRTLKAVEGERSGQFTAGLTEINFYYDRIPASLVVEYRELGTDTQIKVPGSYPGFWYGDDIPAEYAEKEETNGYIYEASELVTPDPMKFDEPSETIIHYYTRILDTDIPEIVKEAQPASGATVVPGEEITYTVTLTNVRSTDALENTVITDAIPAGTTYVEGSADNNGVFENNTLTWNIGSVPAGDNVAVSFKVTVNSDVTGSGNIANTAHVAYRDIQVGEDVELDSNPTTHGLLTFEKTSGIAEGTVLANGDEIDYTVTVKNVGSAPAAAVITDSIPAYTTLSSDPLPEGASVEDGVITFNAELKSGETANFTFKVIANIGEAYTANVVNVAKVNGEPTNEVVTPVERGTAVVRYVLKDIDGTESSLCYGEFDYSLAGAVGNTIPYKQVLSFEKLQQTGTRISDESDTFIAGNINVVYVFERIPATAVVYYKDIDSPDFDLHAPKTVNAYVGDILPETYLLPADELDYPYYDYERTDAPTTLEYTKDGLVITHYYKDIVDTTEISAVKSSVPESFSAVLPGSEITYQIVVTNPRAEEPIENVIVTDPIPAGCKVTDAPGASENEGNLVWNLGTLGAGESRTLAFTVEVDGTFSESGNLENTATVSYTNRKTETQTEEPEPKSIDTNTVNHAVIVVDKAVDKNSANVNDVLTYTFSVTNYGSIRAENIRIIDAAPEGTTLVKGESAKLVIASLEPGETAERSFSVSVDAMEGNACREIISNTAVVNVDGIETNTNEVATTVTQGIVNVTCVDENGNVLRTTETYNGNVGDEYSFTAPEIEGYNYTRVNGKPEGRYVEDVSNIVFVYKRGEGVLTVRYVDENTNQEIQSSYTQVMNIGDKIEDSYKTEIDSYNYVKSTLDDEILDDPDNLDVKMTKEGVEIVHYYNLNPQLFTIDGCAWKAMGTPNSTFDETDDMLYDNLLVTLCNKDGSEVASTTTDKEGHFQFDNVEAGNYQVKFKVPATCAVSDAIGYSEENLNSIASEYGVVDLNVTGPTKNVGIELFGDKTYSDVPFVEPFEEDISLAPIANEPVKVYEPIVTEQPEAIYTSVFGDSDTLTPSTGDSDYGVIIATVIVACSLFALVICRKSR